MIDVIIFFWLFPFVLLFVAVVGSLLVGINMFIFKRCNLFGCADKEEE